jgi:hypothetical protein
VILVKFVQSYTILNLTKFKEKSINVYDIKTVNYEIILHNESKVMHT